MIQPKFNLKTAASDAEAAEDKKLTKQLLMASCASDLQEFPPLWDIKSRQSCYNHNHGEVNTLSEFWNALQVAVSRVFILDAYFLKPEVPPMADESNIICERILVIKDMLKGALLGSNAGLDIKILTDSPYSQDKVKEQEMLASLKEVEELAKAQSQQGNAAVKLSVCLELTKKFNYIHDRFAIIDNELWHFGGTVGGFNSKLSAASRGWDATELKAISFFDEVWQECVR